MTIQNVLDFVNSYKPSKYTDSQKIKWLNQIETEIYNNIILKHEYNEGESEITFEGYTDSTPKTTELIVPAPYDDLYNKYVMAQIDYLNREMKHYNDNIGVYSTLREQFENRYRQSHSSVYKTKTKYY